MLQHLQLSSYIIPTLLNDRFKPWNLFSRNFENKASSVFNFFSPKIETSARSFETAFNKNYIIWSFQGKRCQVFIFWRMNLKMNFDREKIPMHDINSSHDSRSTWVLMCIRRIHSERLLDEWRWSISKFETIHCRVRCDTHTQTTSN